MLCYAMLVLKSGKKNCNLFSFQTRAVVWPFNKDLWKNIDLIDQENASDLLYRTDFFPGLGWMITKGTRGDIQTLLKAKHFLDCIENL